MNIMNNKKIDNKKTPKIGLALSGGGGRGYAHIGVIKTLEKHKIPIDFIAGCSAGALFGSIYAYSKDIEKVEKIAVGNNFKKLLNLVVDPAHGGIIKGDKIMKFISETVHYADFEDLKIPFRAIATDYNTAEPVILCKGDVAIAVQASITVPLVLKPVSLNGKILWDGGMSNPFPTDVAREMGADIVIGVNLLNHTMFNNKEESERNPYSIFVKSFMAYQYSLGKEYAKLADIIINPFVGDFTLIGFDKFVKDRGREFILEGEKATEFALPKIKKLIKDWGQL